MTQDERNAIQLKVGLDQQEADGHGIGGTYYHWCPGGCVFPQDVSAVVINLPVCYSLPGVDHNTASSPITPLPGKQAPSLPFKFIVGEDYRLTGTYNNPTINPAISWNNRTGHIVNGKLLEHREHVVTTQKTQ